jgi:uncharacterized membrane protein
MIDDVTYTTLDTILKFFGKIGFILVLLSVYKFYNAFASPLVKARHRHFIVLYAISMIISLLSIVLNFIIPSDSLSTASMVFSVSITFVLAFYLYRQANILEEYRGSEEFRMLTKSMDSMMALLKYR